MSQQLELSSAYGVIVASDGGPIEIGIDTGEGPRVIYNRPPGDGIATYESDAFVASDASVAVQAASSVSWKVVIVAR